MFAKLPRKISLLDATHSSVQSVSSRSWKMMINFENILQVAARVMAITERQNCVNIHKGSRSKLQCHF